MILDRPIRTIAVLRALFLGDLLVAIPALRALRAGFPQAEITLISLPWAAELARRLDRYLDRFVRFGGYPGLVDSPYVPLESERFLAEQRARGYDLVIQMHGSGGQSNPCAHALGGRLTAGYYLGTRPPYLAPAAPYSEHLPEVVRCLHLVRLLGCPDTGTQLELPLLPSDRLEAQHLLASIAGTGPLIGIHPGAKSPLRRWPAERFAAVADTLARRLGARIVLTGGPHETAPAAVRAHMQTPVQDLSGRTSLGALAAVLSSLSLLVSNDTGPAHLAEAAGTPTVRIDVGQEPGRWEPLDSTRHHLVKSRPLRLTLADGRRWEWPDVDEVVAAAEAFLRERVPA